MLSKIILGVAIVFVFGAGCKYLPLAEEMCKNRVTNPVDAQWCDFIYVEPVEEIEVEEVKDEGS